jgi:hypothetical protein
MGFKEAVKGLESKMEAFASEHMGVAQLDPTSRLCALKEQAFNDDRIAAVETADDAVMLANDIRLFAETLRSPTSVEEDWGKDLAEIAEGPETKEKEADAAPKKAAPKKAAAKKTAPKDKAKAKKGK